jgi:NodT family efflux transporter outer membrane factor (OMF) lipoprotein
MVIPSQLDATSKQSLYDYNRLFVMGNKGDNPWWFELNHNDLNHIIDDALLNNPSIQSANASLEKASALFRSQVGTSYPVVSLKMIGERERYSSPVISNSIPKIVNIFNPSINVAYTFDFFDGIQSQIDTLMAQEDYARYQKRSAYLTLVANLVNATIMEGSYRDQLNSLNAIRGIQNQIKSINYKKWQLGSISYQTYLSQAQLVEQTDVNIQSIQNNLDQTRHTLYMLLGRAPNQKDINNKDIPIFHLKDFKMLREIPSIVPSILINQRPDIQAADALVQASVGQYGLAVSNLLPTISLSAGIGPQATTLSGLGHYSNVIWNLVGQITQPIFNADQLEEQKNAAKSSYDSAYFSYKQTVLAAFKNVVDSLKAIEHDKKTCGAWRNNLNNVQNQLAIARVQLEQGAIDQTSYLMIQANVEQARISLIQSQAQHFMDMVSLYQSMGGTFNDVPNNFKVDDFEPKTMVSKTKPLPFKKITSISPTAHQEISED